MKTQWNIAPPIPEAVKQLFPDVPLLAQTVLWRSGVTDQAAADEFLRPEYESLHDPFLFRHMRRAVDRIEVARKSGERVTIYGDYDADGVTSTVIMFETLQALGCNVQWYIPERLSEGYGLNTTAVEKVIAEGTTLLITVDCGTSNVAEIQRAKELGCDTIVLDHHHEPTELPPALAIINPVFPAEQYPFRGFSSAGVAFTVARAIIAADIALPDSPLRQVGWEKWLLDMVAVSTVSDMMPLRGENRTFVRYGLMVLRKTKRVGLRALFAVMGTAIDRADEYTIGFMIGPRLNAAGRLHHASLAVHLLLTRDQVEAQQLAEQLQGINQDRQRLTEMAVTEALEQAHEQQHAAAVTAFAPHWSPGILGLIAGRLADRLWRPTVVMTMNDGQIVGSGRSVPGVDIMSVMDAGREYFARYGGHPGACGFTLSTADQREAFGVWFQQHLQTQWKPEEAVKTLEIDGRVHLRDISSAALESLEQLGPYGVEHRRPAFCVTEAQVIRASTVGQESKHLRLVVEQDGVQMTCIGFRHGARLAECTPGTMIDVALEPSWNEWQGRKVPQLKILDLRPAHV